MGLGEGQTTGISLHDILSVIKGHVPEGHMVRSTKHHFRLDSLRLFATVSDFFSMHEEKTVHLYVHLWTFTAATTQRARQR